MTQSDKPDRATPRVAAAVTIAAISAAMYRLQETGDPFVIVWAAAAIVLFTCAGVIAQALEKFLSRIFGLEEPSARDEDGPKPRSRGRVSR